MRDVIEKIVEKELEIANKKHQPEFNSAHEGYAVTLEEFEELQDDVFDACEAMSLIWENIKKDETKTIEHEKLLNQLYDAGVRAACEAIQLSAMALKMLAIK